MSGLSEMIDDMVTKARAEGYAEGDKAGYARAVSEVQSLVGSVQAGSEPMTAGQRRAVEAKIASERKDRVLQSPAAAKYVGLTSRALASRLVRGTGPVGRKDGGRWVYKTSDLDAWLELNPKDTRRRSAKRKRRKTKAPAGLLTTLEAAVYLDMPQKRLENQRTHGRGPKATKQGRSVFYAVADLDAWKAKQD